jgi:hypothetical protein
LEAFQFLGIDVDLAGVVPEPMRDVLNSDPRGLQLLDQRLKAAIMLGSVANEA